MPSQSDNLDADTVQNYPVRPEGTGSAQGSEPVFPHAVGIEGSDVLENSTPLEARKVKYAIAPNRAISAPQERSPTPIQSVSEVPDQSISDPIFPTELLRSGSVVEPPIQTPQRDNQAQEIIVPLLDERVLVDRRRRKVGEVVVRKEIETHIVEVPIRREKLIVEQVSPQYEQLAVVELGEAQTVNSATLIANEATQSPTVSGRFASAAEAIQFLAAIAAEPNAGSHDVQITVVLENADQQALYQRLLAHYSTSDKR